MKKVQRKDKVIRKPEKLFTVPEALDFIRDSYGVSMSRATLYRHIQAGNLIKRKLGKKALFTRKDLEAFIASSVK